MNDLFGKPETLSILSLECASITCPFCGKDFNPCDAVNVRESKIFEGAETGAFLGLRCSWCFQTVKFSH